MTVFAIVKSRTKRIQLNFREILIDKVIGLENGA